MIELNFNPFPVIHTNRLTLNEICETDIDALFELRSSIEVMKYIDKPLATTRAEVETLLHKMKNGAPNNTDITWAIRYTNTTEMIGYIGFWRIDFDNHRAEVGYSLLPQYFNKGIATEVLKACIEYMFTQQAFHSIEANINPSNEASRKLLLKTGFEKEAYFKENYYFDGMFLDSEIYSILKSNFIK
jgi:[ribosomal protein S5]-alanine N-acetyltransferase